jgi:hypothetical protein
MTSPNCAWISDGIHSDFNSLHADWHVFNGWHLSLQRGITVSQMSALNLGKHFLNWLWYFSGTRPMDSTMPSSIMTLSDASFTVLTENPSAIVPK